ncbi:MAG: hypothetical protein ACK5S6_04285 [bacterium]
MELTRNSPSIARADMTEARVDATMAAVLAVTTSEVYVTAARTAEGTAVADAVIFPAEAETASLTADVIAFSLPRVLAFAFIRT